MANPNTTTSNYGILSNREKFDDKQKKIIDTVKLDLFESLDIDNKLVNRNNVSKQLEKLRVDNKIGHPWGNIELRPGMNVDITDKDYKDILDKYRELLNKKPNGFEKELRKLDSELAERLVLDQGGAIEFRDGDKFLDGKNAKKESGLVYNSLNTLPQYKNNIELASKKDVDGDRFIIKWTPKELERIRGAEEAIKLIGKEGLKEAADSKETGDPKDTEKKDDGGQTEIIKNLQDKVEKNNKEIEELKKKLNDMKNNKDVENSDENKKEKAKESVEKLDISLFINRDNLARDIANSRLNSNFPIGSIEIKKGEKINLEGQSFFEEFKQKYIEAGDKQKRLKDLDTEFAELIILLSPQGSDISKRYQIQINNDESGQSTKKEEELVQESLRCRDSLQKLGYNVEYVTYKKGSKYENLDENSVQERDISIIKKDSKYREKMKTRLSNLKIGERIIFRQGGEKAVLYKHNETGLIADLCEIDEIRFLIDEDHNIEFDGNESNISHIWNKALLLFLDYGVEKEERPYHIIKLKEEKVIPEEKIIPEEKVIPEEKIIPEEKVIPEGKVIPEEKVIPEGKVIPDEEGTPGGRTDLELDAVISDMGTDVHRERVSLETEEQLRDEYKKTGVWNLPKKVALFLWRGNRRKKLINKKMKALSGKAFSGVQGIDEKTGDASDRHELELQHKLSEVEKANSVTLQNPLVNNLCKDYLNGIVNESGFQTQFNTIVDNDNNIQAILKGEKITHIGTNILLKLKQQKAKIDLSKKVDSELNQYFSDNNQVHINNINKEIEAYIKLYQTNPDFMKDYEDLINNVSGARNKLQLYFKHQGATMKMQIENVKMNMNILVKGKSAYQIDNKDRQKGWMYKLGNKLDKLPRYVQIPGFVGVSVLTGLATGGLGTFAAAAITTGVTASSVGALNAIKKRTHHTKEQNTHEKNVVTDHINEQAKVSERQNQALNGKWYARKTYKAKRQLALYDQTTQDNIQISDTISDTITDLSSKVGILDPKEENYMKKNLIEGWARLKYYRETGHNFLASNDKEQIEKDMRRLEKSLILGSGKLGKTLNDIETMQARDDLGGNITYKSIQLDLRSNYDKSLIQFKRERRNLAVKYGVGTAALSAGMSLGFQWACGTGVFGQDPTPGIDGKELSDKVQQEFNLGKAELSDSTTKNAIYNKGTEVFSANHPKGTEYIIDYGAGTNNVQVIPGRLTQSVYEAKLKAIVENINSMNLSQATKDNATENIMSQPRKSVWPGNNYTNNFLQGMRCAENVENSLQALADSGKDIPVSFAFNPDAAMNSVTEKVGNVIYKVKIPAIPGQDGSHRAGKFIQIPVFFNTFKDRVKGNNEKDDTTIQKDKPTAIKDNINKPNKKQTITNKKEYRDDFRDKNKSHPNKDPYDPGTKKDPKTGEIIPIRDVSNKKVGVSTRKEKIDDVYKDIEDFSPEYPNKFGEKSLDEIAAEVLDNNNIKLYKDPNYQNDSTSAIRLLEQGNRKGAISVIKGILIKERAYIKEQTDKKYNGYIDEIYETITKSFDKYGVKDLGNTLPSKDKIHILSGYEFSAYEGGNKSNGSITGGICYTNHGHIMINHDAIHMFSTDERQQEAILKEILIHELIHDSGVNNYHHFYDLRDNSKSEFDQQNRKNESFIVRRIGLKIIRRLEGNKLFAYGSAMNEAITQMLAEDIGKDILPNGYKSKAYPREKEVISLLQTKFDIPFEMFAKAILNRTRDDEKENNYLRNINEKINGKTNGLLGRFSYQRPEMLRLLMCIMDYEKESKGNFSAEYELTKNFINGRELIITPEMKKRLHPALLKDGILKIELQKAYPNLLDPQAKSATA